LTIERIVAVESPREFRLRPGDRSVAMTQELSGARQIVVLSLRGGAPIQVTASEMDVSDPQWSPDGRRLAYVRGDEIRAVDVDGGRDVLVASHPSGVSMPRWSPDGRTIAFRSRRRGWTQVHLVDAPVPRRGRPARDPRPPEPRAITAVGYDVEDFEWSADGRTIALATFRAPDFALSELHLVDVATGDERRIAGGDGEWATGPRAVPGGGFLYLSDADGWFQVVRLDADGGTKTVLTHGEREHGETAGAWGFAPLASADATRIVHIAIHDALVDLIVAPLVAGPPAKRGRGRPPKRGAASAAVEGMIVNPWPGVWRAVGFLGDGDREVARRDLAHVVPAEQALQLVLVDAERALASDDGGHRGLRSGLGDGARHSLGGLAGCRDRQSLREHGALERDDGTSRSDCLGDRGRNTKRGHGW
jgi:dipeptidyl aminopeptidase/acylaminoacyl peptidase